MCNLYNEVVRSAYCILEPDKFYKTEYYKNPELLNTHFAVYVGNVIPIDGIEVDGIKITRHKFKEIYDEFVNSINNFENKLDEVIPFGIIGAVCGNDNACGNYQVEYNK